MLQAISTPEVQRLALAYGTLLALAYKERMGILPGGIIVPGLVVVLGLLSPLWCLTGLVLAPLLLLVYRRWLQRPEHIRRSPMYFLAGLSLLVSNLVALAYIRLGWLPPSLDELSGTLLPGILACTLHRQQPARVLRGLALTTLATAVLLLLTVLLLQHLGIDLDVIARAYAAYGPEPVLRLQAHGLSFALALLVGFLLYRSSGLRPGGYVVAPVAAALLRQTTSAVFLILGCALVMAMLRLLEAQSLTVGLRRYGAALLFSILWVWGVELWCLQRGVAVLPFQGNHLFVIIAMASYANDLVLQPPRRVLPLMAVSVLVALAVQQLLALLLPQY
ncbi:MAG: poly-gamma-glutamate biosynthesis protein PgsC/CapC [Synechococcus sp. Tobar2m-G35]|nr:poly-gamma-glutamate biosynthesis protein PgsC/CapC [Synechococcus sp. Tobar2m-G35]